MEGLLCVRSVRKVYHMRGQCGRFIMCEVSEESLPYERPVWKVIICEVIEKGLMCNSLLNTIQLNITTS